MIVCCTFEKYFWGDLWGKKDLDPTGQRFGNLTHGQVYNIMMSSTTKVYMSSCAYFSAYMSITENSPTFSPDARGHS